MVITNTGELIDLHIKDEFPIQVKRTEDHGRGWVSCTKHWHKELMLFYIEKGTAVIHCNSLPISVQEGDIVVINPHDVHYVKSSCLQLIKSYILVNLAALSSETDVCQTRYIVPLLENRVYFKHKIEQDAELLQHVMLLIQEYQGKKIGRELLIKAELYAILGILMRRYVIPASQKVKQEPHFPLHLVLEYIEGHYQEKITLLQLAATAHVSPYHLCRLFKQSIGMPPIKYINYIRIDKAKKLLQQHQLKIREAADMVGFSDYNYFSRLFKQYTQQSPSTWQQEAQS